MRTLNSVAWGILVLGLSGCSSSSDETETPPGPCRPNPALATNRDACEFQSGVSPRKSIGDCSGKQIPVKHIVLLMQENRSFDEYFGHLPGHGQDDVDVAPESTTNPDSTGAPVAWHHETKYCVDDTDHGWSASHEEYADGKNDGFAVANENGGDPTGSRALGWYDQTDLPFYYELASTFATSDRYFCSLLGPTYPNRYFFLAGTSFGIVTTDIKILAPNGSPNLIRQLQAANVDWKIYRTTIASATIFVDMVFDPAFSDRIVNISEFKKDAEAGTLPQVAWVDPGFIASSWEQTDEHPPANAQVGQHWVWEQMDALLHSPQWPETAAFITYDEHGGLYDHVPPPPACVPDDTPPMKNPELGTFDRLGFRVPLIVLSPYAKRNFVSHEVHSHTSILRFVQAKFNLPALTRRDANSDAMLDFFDFDAPPNLDVPTIAEPPIDPAGVDACKADFP